MTMILDSVDVSAAALGNLDLKPEQHGQVIFSRYESHDPMVTDTIHGDLWVEEYVVSEHLGLVEDDGCIIRLHGTPRGQVGIAKTGDVLTDEQRLASRTVRRICIPLLPLPSKMRWPNLAIVARCLILRCRKHSITIRLIRFGRWLTWLISIPTMTPQRLARILGVTGGETLMERPSVLPSKKPLLSLGTLKKASVSDIQGATD